MKTRTPLLALILFTLMVALAFACKAQGADILSQIPDRDSVSRSDGKVDERSSPALRLGLEPYGTISWTGLEGAAELGAGANLTLGLTKNLALVGFGESDNTTGGFIDRFGGGLRYTAALGPRVSLDGGVAGGWDMDRDTFFLRLPLGISFYAIKTANADLGLRLQYAFDLDGDGKQGTATGRGFFGPIANFKF